MRLIYALITILLATMVATVLGQIVAIFLPQDSLLTILLTTAVSPGVSLPLKDLGAFSAGFQFQLKLTAVSLCGMVLGTLMALKRIR